MRSTNNRAMFTHNHCRLTAYRPSTGAVRSKRSSADELKEGDMRGRAGRENKESSLKEAILLLGYLESTGIFAKLSARVKGSK